MKIRNSTAVLRFLAPVGPPQHHSSPIDSRSIPVPSSEIPTVSSVKEVQDDLRGAGDDAESKVVFGNLLIIRCPSEDPVPSEQPYGRD